jgi:hypothetical protein
MTETSALEAFIRARKPTFDMAEYHAALDSDWERGRPEEIAEFDADGTGGVIRVDGFTGYVATMRHDHTPLTDFRSIARSATSGFRECFAKDIDGAVWYVGKIKRPGGLPGPSRRWLGD